MSSIELLALRLGFSQTEAARAAQTARKIVDLDPLHSATREVRIVGNHTDAEIESMDSTQLEHLRTTLKILVGGVGMRCQVEGI